MAEIFEIITSYANFAKYTGHTYIWSKVFLVFLLVLIVGVESDFF